MNEAEYAMLDPDDLIICPDSSPWTKWFWGCAVPLSILGYSLWSIVRGSITLPSRGRHSIEIEGGDVYILATAYIALGAFVHFHCFWNLHDRLWKYADRLKIVSLLTFLPCLFVVVVHQMGLYFW